MITILIPREEKFLTWQNAFLECNQMQLNARERHPKVADSETVSKQKWHGFIHSRGSLGRERLPEETSGGEGGTKLLSVFWHTY